MRFFCLRKQIPNQTKSNKSYWNSNEKYLLHVLSPIFFYFGKMSITLTLLSIYSYCNVQLLPPSFSRLFNMARLKFYTHWTINSMHNTSTSPWKLPFHFFVSRNVIPLIVGLQDSCVYVTGHRPLAIDDLSVHPCVIYIIAYSLLRLYSLCSASSIDGLVGLIPLLSRKVSTFVSMSV